MNQISPIGSNPFHMFNVSPAIAQSQANVQMADNTANVQPPMPQSAAPTPAVSNVQNNSVSQNAQNQTTQQSDVNSSAKKISTKTIAAAGAALGLCGGPLAPLTSTVGAIGGAVIGGLFAAGKLAFD